MNLQTLSKDNKQNEYTKIFEELMTNNSLDNYK